jgi:cation diffusion facilitator CzcD-associated flavoprotein CzcO
VTCKKIAVIMATSDLTTVNRPTAQYSFSFEPNYCSTKIYPTGKEFCKYLGSVVAKYDLGKNIQLNTEITELRWIDKDSEWEVIISHLVPGVGDLSVKDRKEKIARDGLKSVQISQERVRAKVVISCAGILVEPNPWPNSIQGRDRFTGEIIHSARWREDVDFTDKDVVVIGTGCTAAQIVPSLLREPYHVKSLTQIMRSAPWVMPRIEEPFGREKYARYAPTVFRYFPFLGFLFRAALYLFVECLFLTVFQAKNEKWRKGIENSMLSRMHERVPKKYHQLMTPDYPYGCKRRVFDTDWFTSMHNPKYKLTDRRVLTVDGNELSLGSHQILKKDDGVSADDIGARIRADIIVLANGFDATHYLHPIMVKGRNGALLHEIWGQRGGPSAYLGTAVHGFPNFFMICGPNTASGHNSILFTIENMVNYVISIAKPVLTKRATVAEIKVTAEAKWTEEVHRDLKKTVFEECKSWYMDEKGYNSVVYP